MRKFGRAGAARASQPSVIEHPVVLGWSMLPVACGMA